MSKTLLRRGSFYLTEDEFERLDRLRGFIPRSRMGAFAMQRLLDDIERNGLQLIPKQRPEPEEPTTTTAGDQENESAISS
jgi:hypothetical protein